MTTFHKRDIPFTSDDLRRVADQIDTITRAVGDDDLAVDDWRWGLQVVVLDEDGKAVGQVKPTGDGWLGFYPIGVTA